MKCEDVQNSLPAFFDGELDVVRHVQIEEHLAGCDACASKLAELRALRTALSDPALYHRAPAALRARLQHSPGQLDREPRSAIERDRWRPYPRLAAIAAGILLLVTASALTALYWSNARTADDQFAELVVAAHVRSLQAKHLEDVPSTDQHTVKPWFDGKLDFAPQVPDLSARGFTLTGGRLDYLLDRPIAALVYFRRLHPINLFIWPAANGDEEAVRKIARQGFQIRHWQHAGMTYWAISDANGHDLDEFVGDFQELSPGPSR